MITTLTSHLPAPKRLLVTLYGLSATISSPRTGGIAYHLGSIVILAVMLVVLLLPAGRRSLSH